MMRILKDTTTRNFMWALAVVALLGSCDNSIEPLLENDRYYYSIFGFLDTEEDTQWVRVMPVRDSVFLSPKPIDATVTLEHTGSGQTITLNDSLFRYGDEAYAYNFWTDEELLPGETYYFTARRSDDKESTATITFPADFPPLEVIDLPQEFNPVDYVLVFDVERLAFAQVVYELVFENNSNINEGRTIGVNQLENSKNTNFGFEISVDPAADLEYVRRLLGQPTVELEPLRVVVAAAGSDWPEFENFDEEDLALPDGVTNIEMGVGYLAPIIRKTAPYE